MSALLSETGWMIAAISFATATITKALTSLVKFLARVKADRDIVDRALEGSSPAERPKIIRACGEIVGKPVELPAPRQSDEDRITPASWPFHLKHNTPSTRE